MKSRERSQVAWCISEAEALFRRLSDCDLPNLASRAAGIRGTLKVLFNASKPKPRRVRLAPGTQKTG